MSWLNQKTNTLLMANFMVITGVSSLVFGFVKTLVFDPNSTMINSYTNYFNNIVILAFGQISGYALGKIDGSNTLIK